MNERIPALTSQLSQFTLPMLFELLIHFYFTHGIVYTGCNRSKHSPMAEVTVSRENVGCDFYFISFVDYRSRVISIFHALPFSMQENGI